MRARWGERHRSGARDVFSHTMLALDAAIDGQGVALTPRFLAEREIAQRTLEVLDQRAYTTGTGIYLAWPRRSVRTLSPAATLFRDWLIDEAKAAEAAGTTVTSRKRSISARRRDAPS